MFLVNWGAHRAREVAEVSASLAKALLAAQVVAPAEPVEVNEEATVMAPRKRSRKG